MRNFSQGFETQIAKTCTTLCWAWKLTRVDGLILGFTDHDRPLYIEGQSYLATSGFSPKEVEQRLGFSLDNSAVLGALSTDQITKADVEAGLYGGAQIEILRVNWQDPQEYGLIWQGRLGDITLRDGQFEAELVGLGAVLDRSTGRVFSRQCGAEFGGEKCGVDITLYPPGTQCPHTQNACRDQFGNIENYRGFPYLIGDDASYAAPRAGEVKDGASRYTS